MGEQSVESASTTPTIKPSPSLARRPLPALAASEPALRFPSPHGSPQLANWVTTSSPDIMESPRRPEEGSLADSTTFEMVGTDVESQDGVDCLGTDTESPSEIDCCTPDDIHSLADTDRPSACGEASDEEDPEPLTTTTSLQYTRRALHNPSSQQHPQNPAFAPSPGTSTPLSESIEFKEEIPSFTDGPIYLDRVSVKHTIREFSEAETAVLTSNMDIRDAPKRLVATVRQTMSKGYLSTRQPLRLLYVGDMAGERDIIHKISSALTASALMDGTGRPCPSETDGVYNIVPITDIGTYKDPDVALMTATEYQIKVEHCTAAEELSYEGESFPAETVYSLTVDRDKVYNSVDSPRRSAIQPEWSLPHVAVFYCTDGDDEKEEKKRTVVWKFMSRHRVPCIFISHLQSFRIPTGQWADRIQQHAVHLCLESRDPNRPIPPQRLPIDLASFLNIDARQMNRNLAFLTELEDPMPCLLDRTKPRRLSELPEVEPLYLLMSARKAVRKAGRRIWDNVRQSSWLYPMLALASGILISLLLSVSTRNLARPVVLPSSSSTTVSIISTTSVAPSTATVTVSYTSTKTVEIVRVRPSSTSSFGGFLSDTAQTVVPAPEATKTVCSVEIYGDKEILIKMPAGNKAVWLSRGAIEVDVLRGDQPVKSKLSSIDEGILVEISNKDAYGVLNVSVVTSRRPKINETFVVSFGKPGLAGAVDAGVHILQDVAKKIARTVEDGRRVAEDTCAPAIGLLAAKLRKNLPGALEDASKTAQEYSSRVKEETVRRLHKTLSPAAITNALKDAQDELSRQYEAMQGLREELDISVLKAQVASKLWWLKIQGKMAEHDEYAKKAKRFVKTKTSEVFQARHARRYQEQESMFLWRSHRCSHSDAQNQEDSGKWSPWATCGRSLRKMLG